MSLIESNPRELVEPKDPSHLFLIYIPVTFLNFVLRETYHRKVNIYFVIEYFCCYIVIKTFHDLFVF